MTATTVRAGVMWKALTDSEKDAAIEQANAIIAARPATIPKPVKVKRVSKNKPVATPEELFLAKQAIRRAKELDTFTAKQAEKSQREFTKFTEELKMKVKM
jgi:hypothetical protein